MSQFVSKRVPTQEGGGETAVANWHVLYQIGAVSALIFIVYSLVTMVLLLTLGGPPQTAGEAFALLQENRLLGLLRLDALTLLTVPLYYPLFLALYQALKKTNVALATLAALLAVAGVTLFLATPSAFSLVPLSERYAAAETAVAQERLLAAGEALLAADMWHSAGAVIGGVLMLIAALLLSGVMLRSRQFSRATAAVGLATHGLDLAHSLVSIVAPQIGIVFMAIAGPLYLIWFPLLARDFLRLGRIRDGHS